MITKKKNSQVKPNYKFYIFIGVIVAAAIVAVVLITNIQTAVVEQGEILFEKQLPVVVVRDEQVVTAQNYGKANFLAQEGQRVDAGANVAEVYKWGYNDKVMNELIEIQTKIEQYQENEMLKDVQDPKLQEVNTQITQKSEEINHIINGEQDGDLVLAERELKDLMTQKQQYLRESVAADQQLQDFYSQEKQLLERVDAWREMVSAPQAGVISFYLDGAESVLNAANIKKITSADVTDILNGSTVKQEVTVDSEAEKPLFRLVNNFKWFLIAKSDTPIDELSNSTVISIAFDDYLDKQYTGTVVGSVAEENTYIYAIEIADDIGALLNTRRTDAKIFTKFEGFKVPKNAIKTREDMIGVYVVTGHDRTFVPVDIKIEKDGYAIITPLSQNSILSVNQHVEV